MICLITVDTQVLSLGIFLLSGLQVTQCSKNVPKMVLIFRYYLVFDHETFQILTKKVMYRYSFYQQSNNFFLMRDIGYSNNC